MAGVVADLAGLGVVPGQRVRFREPHGGRWKEGRAAGVERDGSIGVIDAKGAARAIAPGRLEVRTAGRKGTARWEAMAVVVARSTQLDLF